MRQKDGSAPLSIFVHVFSGRVEMIEIYDGDPHGPVRCDLFAPNGDKLNAVPFNYSRPDQRLPKNFVPPPSFVHAVGAAGQIGASLDYAQIDFLSCDDVLYAGEFTFYPAAGYARWIGSNIAGRLASAWHLGDSWFLTSQQVEWRRDYAERLRRHLELSRP